MLKNAKISDVSAQVLRNKKILRGIGVSDKMREREKNGKDGREKVNREGIRRGSRWYDTRDLCLCNMVGAAMTGRVLAFFDGPYLYF